MQKTILKQQYENFTASRSEGLDKIYDRFQKLISQLEIHDEVISQEDANLKLLRSLPLAWNNIALIMRNKPDLDIMSMDDLYNNLKVYEDKIKSQSSSSSSPNSQNIAFVSLENTSSTNEAINTAHEVFTANSQGQASSSFYANDVMFSLFVSKSNTQQLDNEDLEQIDTDDLEEMDLKWQVAMLTMRVNRFLKKTGRNMNFNGKETVSFDKTKVECYNCHRRGHFARECRAPRNHGNRNGDVSRRIVPIKTPANALVVQDGIGGYDWSFQAEEGPTDFALMAHLSSGSSSSSSSDPEVSTCSKDCLKSYKSLKEHFDKQKEQLKKSNLEIIGYQLGLESLEARIVVHEKNEASYEESIAFLNQISVKDKTGLGFDSHVNESEVFDNVVDSHECNQVNDRFKKSEGYHVVPPSFTGNFKPARADLSFDGLDGFVYKSKVSETITSVPNVDTTESDSEDENVFEPKEVKKTVKSSFENIKFVNARNSTVEKPKNFNHLIKDCDFHDKKMVQKPVLNNVKKGTDQREVRQVWNNAMRVNHQNFYNSRRDFAPTAVLTKSGIVPISAARQSSSRAATPASAARPINTATPKPFGNKVTSAVREQGINVVKSSVYLIWRPKGNVIDHISKDSRSYMPKRFDYGNPQYALQDQGIFDSGCSRHITGNKFYLSDYQEIDGGFVAFGGSSKGEENAEFHQIVDFLSTCSINYALTVSPTIYASYIEQFWNTATSKTVNSVKQIHAIVDGKAVVISESSVRSDLLFNDEDGIACLTNDEIFKNLALMGYEQLSTKLTFQKAKKVTELPQTSVPLDHGADEAPRNHGGAPAQTRSERVLEKPNEPPIPEGFTSGSGEGNMEHTFELMDNVPNTPHDSLLLGGNTPGSDKGRMILIQELMETCTSLTKRVLALEKAKTTQDRVITRLKLRVKRLEKKRKVRTPQPMKRRLFKVKVETSTDKSLGEDASKQGRNDDKIEELNLIDGADTEVIVEDKGSGEKGGSTADQVSTARPEVSAAIVPTLVKMRSEKAKEKEKGVVLIDEEEPPRLNRSTTTLQPLRTIDPKDKGKSVLVEEEPEKPVKVKRRDQRLAKIESDAELAQRLHKEELSELERAQKERQKQEEATSAALAEEFNEIQARIDADHELAVRLTHEEQEKYIIKERARLLVEFFEKRKKQLAAERAEAIRNKPPTRTQVRNRMITYLKHMGKDTHQQLKHKNFEEELRDSMDVVPRDDVAIDVESLATKYPIIDWKTHILNENMMYYQIIRADESSKNYKIFSEMPDDFDRQDVIDLHRLVNERYETTSPEGYDLLLWGDLKTLFEPNEEDEIWKNQRDYNLIS
ncbi:ribonuclease H-like domain-containing protein [Tanacetum coccineum]